MTEVGYRRPPASTRFVKGRSGNPKGRPRERHNRPPYEAVLDQVVVLREEGTERRVTAAEAFLLYTTKRGLDGDGAAARSAMTAIEEGRAARGPDLGHDDTFTIDLGFVAAGILNMALIPLGMATKLDRYRPSARMMIEPWLIQAALARLGDRQLSPDEQAAVVQATRTPHKVRWPDWWRIRPSQAT